MSDVDVEALTAQWQRSFPRCPPMGSLLNNYLSDRWVRFHSLPGAKRYADNEAEYRIILDRHNSILRELGSSEVYLMTARYGPDDLVADFDPVAVGLHPDAVMWMQVVDPKDAEYSYDLYVSRQHYEPGCFDPLLRHIADDKAGGVIIADTALRWLYHPYDGGCDVVLPTSRDRDLVTDKFIDWLGDHPLRR